MSGTCGTRHGICHQLETRNRGDIHEILCEGVASTESMENQPYVGLRQSPPRPPLVRSRLRPQQGLALQEEALLAVHSEAHHHHRRKHHRHWLERVAPLATQQQSGSIQLVLVVHCLRLRPSARHKPPSVDRTTGCNQQFVKKNNILTTGKLPTHPWKIALPESMILPQVVV